MSFLFVSVSHPRFSATDGYLHSSWSFSVCGCMPNVKILKVMSKVGRMLKKPVTTTRKPQHMLRGVDFFNEHDREYKLLHCGLLFFVFFPHIPDPVVDPVHTGNALRLNPDKVHHFKTDSRPPMPSFFDPQTLTLTVSTFELY